MQYTLTAWIHSGTPFEPTSGWPTIHSMLSMSAVECEYMLEFSVANLVMPEPSFEIPSSLGTWQLARFGQYEDLLHDVDQGKCANTYYASLDAVGPQSSDAEFGTACDEIIDFCLVLSFLTARCVTPSGDTPQSVIHFLGLHDKFVRPRGIVGFPAAAVSSMTSLFAAWICSSYQAYRDRTLRLQLCHWLSGLTCFSLEDLYLACGVQMDIVKQVERRVTGNSRLEYFQGMKSASTRYRIPPLGHDYTKMRNDIVHQGVLSGNNFTSRSKAECAAVVADALNWLDSYVMAVIGKAGMVSGLPRWKGGDLVSGLAALSVS